jgi:hypothetical protein
MVKIWLLNDELYDQFVTILVNQHLKMLIHLIRILNDEWWLI